MLQSINYQQLAKALLQTGLTTAELGRRIGLSQPAVSRLAAGLTGAVSAEVGVKLIVLAGGQVQLPPEMIVGAGQDPAIGDGASQALPSVPAPDNPPDSGAPPDRRNGNPPDPGAIPTNDLQMFPFAQDRRDLGPLVAGDPAAPKTEAAEVRDAA